MRFHPPLHTLLSGITLLAAASCAGPQHENPSAPSRFAPTKVSADEDAIHGSGHRTGALPALSSSLSLEDALLWIQGNNPDLSLAAARIAQASAELEASQIAFRPWMNLNLNLQRADAPSTYLFKTIDARRFTPGTNFNDPGAFTNWEAGLSAGYNLYSGGGHVLGKKIAAIEQHLRSLDVATLRNQLTATTFDIWFRIQSAQQLVHTAEQSLATVRAQRQEVQSLYKEGQVLKSDLLSLDVRLAEAEEQRLSAENSVKIARVALSTLMGISSQRLPQLAVENAQVSAIDDLSLDQALQTALQQRPELTAARLRIEQAQLRLQQADQSQLPSIDLFGNAWADSPSLDFDGSEANWSLGIAASWRVFDGGAQQARSAMARAAQMATIAADHKAWQQVQADVEVAFLRVEDANARIPVATRAVEFSKESLRMVRVQHEGGTATITRYLEAEQMHTAASLRLVQVTFDLQRAKVGLDRAMGSSGAGVMEIEQ